MCSAMPSPTPGRALSFLSSLRDGFDALGEAFEQLGDSFVAAIAADDGAVDFEQLGCFAEDFGDFAIFHAGII